eukprot:361723-Chlamydomonas_euryale.AAC.8
MANARERDTFSHSWSVLGDVHAAAYDMRGENDCSPSPAPRGAVHALSKSKQFKRRVLYVCITHFHTWFGSSGVF